MGVAISKCSGSFYKYLLGVLKSVFVHVMLPSALHNSRSQRVD